MPPNSNTVWVFFFFAVIFTGPREVDNTSTLKSSLVTVTDWSDSSDI